MQWEASAGGFSPDGKLAIYDINADGLQTTYLYDLASGKATAVADAARIDGSGWNAKRVLSRRQFPAAAVPELAAALGLLDL